MGDILFLVHRIPFPPDRGDKIRSFNILKKLTTIAPVHCVCFADDDEDMAHGETLRPMVSSLHVESRRTSTAVSSLKALATGKPVSLTGFNSAAVRAKVSELLRERDIDTVFVFSGQMAQYVPIDLGGRQFIMDFVDMDSAKFSDYAADAHGPMRWMYRREARKLFAFEKNVARRANRSLFVSETEAALFREHSGLGANVVQALENGIDFRFFDPSLAIPDAEIRRNGPLIVFTGQMDYRPNIDAVTSFANDSFPAIRNAVPDARFAIVGRKPTAEVEKITAQPGVIVTGGVVDIRSWLAAADVIVAPLRIARGIQNKVLEAMAMGKAIVASKAAFEGIDAVPDRDLVVAEKTAEADAVIGLIEDAERRDRLGAAARKHVVSRYSWDSVLAPLDDMLGVSPPTVETSQAA